MKTIALEMQDDYYAKFVSLLEALPKGAVRVVDAPKGSLSKETLSRIEEYKSGASDISPIKDEFWDEMDRHIDRLCQMKIIHDERFRSELKTILAFIAKDKPSAAKKFNLAVQDKNR